MKKNMLRILAVVLVSVMILTVLAGCRRDADGNNGRPGASDGGGAAGNGFTPPEYVFVPDFISLPDEMQEIESFVYMDGLVYLTNVNRNPETWEATYSLFSMEPDGSNLTKLENFATVDAAGDGSNENWTARGSSYIAAMIADNDGNLWVAESGWVEYFDLPDDFGGEIQDMYEYYVDFGNVMAVRKLDTTGRELLSVDISNIPGGSESLNLSAFNIDGAGNIYVSSSQWDSHTGESSEKIIVLSGDGNVLFSLEPQERVEQLIRLNDGTVASFGWGGEAGYLLQKIDVDGRAFGETIELPSNAWQIFPGGDEFLVIFSDGTDLFGLSNETGEVEILLNWLNSDVVINSSRSLVVLPDGRILCTNQQWDRLGNSKSELILLTRMAYSELPERTILTLATVGLNWTLRGHIAQFNRTNQSYRVHVLDFFDSDISGEDGSANFQAGIKRLSTELISGNIPDILDVSNLPFNQYVARGLLVDLKPLIDADPELSRSDFLEGAFRAAEMDGSLYRVFSSFTINTLLGSPDVLGPGIGWNMDEFFAVLDANPNADMPIGQWLTRNSFLSQALVLGIDEYVDWATGNVYFDTGAFAQLLELSNTFPEERNTGDMSGSVRADVAWEGEYLSEQELIATGRQIMAVPWNVEFESISQYRAMFGGELVFKGFPTENRNGNYISIYGGLSIANGASNQEGAWEFVRATLSSEWQQENMQWGLLPTSRTVFDNIAAEAMNREEYEMYFGWGDVPITVGPTIQSDIDRLLELIDSVAGVASQNDALLDIIMEGAEDFFNGRLSAEDAARIIQSRAAIFVSEQS